MASSHLKPPPRSRAIGTLLVSLLVRNGAISPDLLSPSFSSLSVLRKPTCPGWKGLGKSQTFRMKTIVPCSVATYYPLDYLPCRLHSRSQAGRLLQQTTWSAVCPRRSTASPLASTAQHRATDLHATPVLPRSTDKRPSGRPIARIARVPVHPSSQHSLARSLARSP